MKSLIRPIIAVATLLLTIGLSDAQSLINHGKASRFIDPSVQILIGGSSTTNNYMDCFHQISEINTSMRPAWGLGALIKLNFSKFFGIQTGLNLTFNSSRLDMAVTESASYSDISNVFVRNSYRYIDIPVAASFTFFPTSVITWNVDAGIYYDYGLSGSSRTTLYDARTNELGQLITRVDRIKSDYFNDNRAFINSFRRSDIGMHIATGLTFFSRVSVSVTFHYGFKNVANTQGLVHPSCHNLNVFVGAGYHF